MSQQGSLSRTNVAGNVVQVAENATSAFVGVATIIPFDATIPQQTEGSEVFTITMTPTKSTNRLLIEFTTFVGATGVAQNAVTMALFQDATAGALAATCCEVTPPGITDLVSAVIRHAMVAGTTSPTTFKIRIGNDTIGDTCSINGSPILALYGGVASTLFTVTEIEV